MSEGDYFVAGHANPQMWRSTSEGNIWVFSFGADKASRVVSASVSLSLSQSSVNWNTKPVRREPPEPASGLEYIRCSDDRSVVEFPW